MKRFYKKCEDNDSTDVDTTQPEPIEPPGLPDD